MGSIVTRQVKTKSGDQRVVDSWPETLDIYQDTRAKLEKGEHELMRLTGKGRVYIVVDNGDAEYVPANDSPSCSTWHRIYSNITWKPEPAALAEVKPLPPPTNYNYDDDGMCCFEQKYDVVTTEITHINAKKRPTTLYTRDLKPVDIDIVLPTVRATTPEEVQAIAEAFKRELSSW